MFKPLHYYTLCDLALDFLSCIRPESDGGDMKLLRIEVVEALEASKKHLPTPLTEDQVTQVFIKFIKDTSPPFTESCLPFHLAYILHHIIVEDCNHEKH